MSASRSCTDRSQQLDQQLLDPQAFQADLAGGQQAVEPLLGAELWHHRDDSCFALSDTERLDEELEDASP